MMYNKNVRDTGDNSVESGDLTVGKGIENETIGMNIKRLRKEKGMTQDDLAKAAFPRPGADAKA